MVKDQHTIPQTYLKGFACNRETNEKPYVWRYQVPEIFQSKKPVPVDSLTAYRYIYEVTDSDGNIVLDNHLEKSLGRAESMFNQFRNSVENRVKISRIGSEGFFTEMECGFLAWYILIQLFRTPWMLSVIESSAQEFFGESISDNQAYNTARLFSLPFWRENPLDTKEGQLFKTYLEQLGDKEYSIGVSLDNDFYTSDDPVIAIKDNSGKRIEEIWFPFTSKLFIRIHKSSDHFKSGALFRVDRENVDTVNRMTIINAKREFYSDHRLSKSEIIAARGFMPQREEKNKNQEWHTFQNGIRL